MYAINPIPFWGVLKKYHFKLLRDDIVAAISVSLLALPQAMAYAFLADLPASAGIWAAVFGTIFAAAFGQSPIVVAGTTNMIAIMLQSGTSEILYTYYSGLRGVVREEMALNIVLQLSLIVGVFQILAALLRLGRITQFTSRSVVIGYIAGAALAIIVTQLFPFFGIPEADEYHTIYSHAIYLFSHMNALHAPTAALAIGSLAIIIVLYLISEKIPAAAIVFILSAFIVAFFRFDNITLVKDIGFVSSDFPLIALPFFEMRILGKLLPLAFAITLLSALETTAIGRSYTKAKDLLYNDNQEIYGLGLSNIVCSFVGGMPNAGSFSRSALNHASHAKTRFAAIFSGVFVLILVIAFGFWVDKIPIASLSALMLFTAFTMVNFRDLSICIKATPGDAVVVIATFASSLFFTLDATLYIGIVLAIALYLKRAAIPHLIEYTFNNAGKLRPMIGQDERLDPRICIFQAEGGLFFGAADPLQAKLRRIAEDENVKVVILQLLNTRYLDASVCLALEKIISYFNATHRHFILSGISEEVWIILGKTGLLKQLGESNCFAAKRQVPGEATRQAYAHAKTLIIS